MTAPITALSHLVNPLASSEQLETSSSQLDGVPKDLEDSVRFATARLLQAAGILLRLPQEIIARAIIVLCRFWVGPDGGSMLENDAEDVAAASLYLTAKPSGHAVSPRQTLTVFAYLRARGIDRIAAADDDDDDGNDDPAVDWRLSDGEYDAVRTRLYAIESRILRVLGYQTHVALPYTLCVNYLQTLDVFRSPAEGAAVSRRAIAHLNTALLSPQLLLLTHQPSALATAAIYLAAREVGVKLPEVEWWEVFDVDREELGFLVVALLSVEGFAAAEKKGWGRRKVPLTVEGLRIEIEARSVLEAGA